MSNDSEGGEFVLLPAGVPAGHFLIAATFTHLLLGFGVSRLRVNDARAAEMGVEWPITVSLSPESAKELLGKLSEALAGYEKDYGEIRVAKKE